MAIKNWHVGKIVLCWIAGLVLIGLSIFLLNDLLYHSELSPILEFIIGLLLLALLVGSPLFLFVVTWKWFSGRERKGPPTSK